MIIMPLFFACPYTYGEVESAPSYSQDIMELAKNLLASYELFEKGKRLFKKRDYMDARATFQDALDKDSKNEKAGKYLLLCDKKIATLEKSEEEKEEKERERSEWEQQADIEARLLKDLERRIRELETKKDEEPEKETAVEWKKLGEQLEPEKPAAKTADDKELEETMLREEEIRKSVIESEDLVEQGNLYFQNQEYEKAYDFYRKALKSLK